MTTWQVVATKGSALFNNMRTYVKRHRVFTALALLIAGVVGAVSFALVPGSSYFTSSTSVAASGKTGYAELTQNNPGACTLAFGEVDPGQTGTATCTLKNTGSVPLDIAVTGLSNPTFTGGGSGLNLALLSAQIDGFVGFQPVTQYSVPIAVGHLDPGAQFTYSFRLKLDPTAGNEWANVNWSVNVTFTGIQSH